MRGERQLSAQANVAPGADSVKTVPRRTVTDHLHCWRKAHEELMAGGRFTSRNLEMSSSNAQFDGGNSDYYSGSGHVTLGLGADRDELIAQNLRDTGD